MDTSFLTCPICYEEYDSAKHQARIVPTCGHTICTACLMIFLQKPHTQRKCPIDSQLFPSDLIYVQLFKVNFIVNQFIELQATKEICDEHHEEINFVCLTDQKKICNMCMCEPTHQGHKVKTLKAIKAEANNQLKKVKGILRNLEECHTECKQISKEMKTLLVKRVRDEFGEMKKLLADKEQEIIFQINSSFSHQELKVDDFIGNNSEIKKNLDSQVSTLDGISKTPDFKNENLYQDVEQHLVNYKVDLDTEAVEEERGIIKFKMEDMFQSFKSFLDLQSQIWGDLKFVLEDDLFKGLCRGVLKDLPATPDGNENRMETEDGSSTLFRIDTYLCFQYDGEELQISSSGMPQRDSVIDMEQWKNAKDVTLKIEHELSDDIDLPMLCYIWRRLKGTGILYLKFSNSKIAKKIINFLTQNTNAFSRVEICLEEQDLVNERETAMQFGMLLCNSSNLQEIKLQLDETRLTRRVLQAFIEARLSDASKINLFSLSLAKTNILDDDICRLPLNLPHLKHFSITLDDTKITSKTIEWLANSCLHTHSASLEVLRLYLDSTKVTDHSMDTLLLGLGKLKKLTLDMGSTNVTNKTLEVFTQALPNFSESLEELDLGLHSCSISDRGLSNTFGSLPKIAHYCLLLSRTKITDKSIEIFAEKTLTSMMDLKYLRMDLSHTGVTDYGMCKIFQNILSLKELILDLTSTKVTDDSIAPFIIDKVMNMAELASFQMNVSNTHVSNDVKSKIKDLEALKNAKTHTI